MSIKISIIIPVYKVADYIGDCLESVVNQDYGQLEVVLVDDASPDNSIDIAKGIIAASNRSDMFKIIRHEVNRGLSAARNSGIDVATGDFLYFLDSDDTLPDKEAIRALCNCIQDADIVIGNYRGVRSDSSYVSKYNQKCRLEDEALIQAFVRGDVPIMAWNKLIVRKYFDEGLRFKEGILNEDELFSYQLLFKNPKIAMAGVVTYNYNIRPGSIMTTFNMNRLLSPIIVYEEVTKAYKAIHGNHRLILANLDHFAFKRYVDIMRANADAGTKRQLYKRLCKAQRNTNGVGKMRYLYNCHIFFPATVGFMLMQRIAKVYAKSRNL